MTTTQSEKERLLAQRDALRARLDSIAADYKRGLDPDSEERAVQLENAEVLDGIARATSEELQQIEQRLAQIDSENR